jgi:hypothetical protein
MTDRGSISGISLSLALEATRGTGRVIGEKRIRYRK